MHPKEPLSIISFNLPDSKVKSCLPVQSPDVRTRPPLRIPVPRPQWDAFCLSSIKCVWYHIFRRLLPPISLSRKILSPGSTEWQPLELAMADRLTTEQIEEVNELQQRYFNENVDLFEPPLPKGVTGRLKATIKAGRLRRGEKVLDIGTGTGILIPYILEYGPSEIHACDLAENMLRRVKEKFPRVITHLCERQGLAASG